MHITIYLVSFYRRAIAHLTDNRAVCDIGPNMYQKNNYMVDRCGVIWHVGKGVERTFKDGTESITFTLKCV